MPSDVVTLARELVQTPSVNPMGRPGDRPEHFERQMGSYLERFFADRGWAWERHEVHPGRDNLLARLDGASPPEQGGGLLMFEVHQDTVPTEGMTISPFAAEVRDERLYGRGACDIKGAMAAMLVAMEHLAQLPATDRPNIVLACTVNEEHGFTGATHLADLARSGRSRLLPRLPDGIIVAEPTLLQVVHCHKGVIRWRCRTVGRAAHSSAPERGHSAIYDMARVIAALERYASDQVGGLASHPELGRPTLSIGTIAGGLSVNTVPAECTIEIDRRVLPGEDPQAAWEHVARYVAGAVGSGVRVEHESPFITSPGLSETTNERLARHVSEQVARLEGNCAVHGVPFGTDAAALAAVGGACVVFGPGDIAQAHTEDEWIEVDQLRRGVTAYVEIARTFSRAKMEG